MLNIPNPLPRLAHLGGARCNRRVPTFGPVEVEVEGRPLPFRGVGAGCGVCMKSAAAVDDMTAAETLSGPF